MTSAPDLEVSVGLKIDKDTERQLIKDASRSGGAAGTAFASEYGRKSRSAVTQAVQKSATSVQQQIQAQVNALRSQAVKLSYIASGAGKLGSYAGMASATGTAAASAPIAAFLKTNTQQAVKFKAALSDLNTAAAGVGQKLATEVKLFGGSTGYELVSKLASTLRNLDTSQLQHMVNLLKAAVAASAAIKLASPLTGLASNALNFKAVSQLTRMQQASQLAAPAAALGSPLARIAEYAVGSGLGTAVGRGGVRQVVKAVTNTFAGQPQGHDYGPVISRVPGMGAADTMFDDIRDQLAGKIGKKKAASRLADLARLLQSIRLSRAIRGTVSSIGHAYNRQPGEDDTENRSLSRMYSAYNRYAPKMTTYERTVSLMRDSRVASSYNRYKDSSGPATPFNNKLLSDAIRAVAEVATGKVGLGAAGLVAGGLGAAYQYEKTMRRYTTGEHMAPLLFSGGADKSLAGGLVDVITKAIGRQGIDMSKVTNDSGRNGSFQRLSARLDVTEAAMQRGAYSGTRNISGFSEFGGLKETVDGLRVKMNALSAVISGGGGSESLIANFEAVSNAFKRAQALLEFDFNKRQSDSFGFGAGLSATQIWEKARTPKVLESAAMVGINKARKDFSRDAFIEETGPRADAESANRRSRLSLAEAMADVRRERIHADRLRAVGTVSMGTGAADIPKLMATAIQDAQKAALENTKAADDSGARMATLMQQDYDRQQAWDKQVLAWRTEDNTKKRALLTQLQDIWSTITGKDSGSPAQ